jgi:hypothetical protein
LFFFFAPEHTYSFLIKANKTVDGGSIHTVVDHLTIVPT